MFSPAQNGGPAPSTRTSRRRQRPDSNDSFSQQPKAKRQRSTISDHTFVAPDGAPEMQEAKNHKIPALAKHDVATEAPGRPSEMIIRGKKPRLGERNSKGDGSVVLTANDTYTVSKLPASPDPLRTKVSVKQHGAIFSDNGYALTLTHSHAIVWPYAVNIPSPETFQFEIPEPSRQPFDPLPLGSLVSAAASSSYPGLVVVVPTSGKITYWESISSATTMDFTGKRNGVELSIPGMLSGEKVIQVLNAESAGFVLAFSSGRVAYMSVRDGQGRPAISVSFLRSSGHTGAGIFGSLRNALSSSALRGDIAAVRAGQPDKVGERNVVVATAKGKIQSWKVHRGGHASIDAEAECQEAVVMAIKESAPALRSLHLESFEVLDFTYTPKSLAESQLSGQSYGTHLLLLSSLTSQDSSHYFLVEVVLNQDELQIGNLRPITSYTTPVNRDATSKPRLYLPNPALVAYVVFDKAVIVMSMAKQPESPEMQLRSEGHLMPKQFEDVIDFRDDIDVEIVGSGMEEPHGSSAGIDDSKSPRYKAKHPATVLIVRGGGVVRIAATDTVKLASRKAQQVTAKSKLEQAVFFGTLEANPLSFAVRPEFQFPAEEMGAAALELSDEILKSATPYIPSVPASIEQNLRKRSSALQDLAFCLRKTGIVLDRVTRWKLLWDAERVAAATQIWKKYDSGLRKKPAGQKRGLLTEVIEFIHEEYKTEPLPEAGELDRVRLWFVKDIYNLEVAVPWAYQVIKYTYQDGQKDHGFIMDILSEANDLVLGALQTAFDFRSANANLYGLGTEELEHGILRGDYTGLPGCWTSTSFIVANLRKQLELASLLMSHQSELGEEAQAVVEKIRAEYSTLLDLSIRSSSERARWLSAQDDEGLRSDAEKLKEAQGIAQDTNLKSLAIQFELPHEAIDLAEKHALLPTLASILQYELDQRDISMRRNTLGRELFEQYAAEMDVYRDRVKSCFVKFGTKWATALFQLEIEEGSMSDLLNAWTEQQPYLTAFLRSKPEYAKLSWINDITREEDYEHASDSLLDLGLHREEDVWSKKIELSMGKLALLAGRSHILANEAQLTPVHDQLSLVKIQNTIYDFVLPSIENALDENAELQLALEAHGNGDLKKQPMLAIFLEESMTHLVNHRAMNAYQLIDLLTLMGDSGSFEQQLVFCGQRFYLALEASRHGLHNKDDKLLLQRIIWRRCMLRDDWAKINDTAEMDDEQVVEQVQGTALYLTLRACFENRMFEKTSELEPFRPVNVLGAGTEDLELRFRASDKHTRERIMADMQGEDDALEPLIERSRLDGRYDDILSNARAQYMQELGEETDSGAKIQQARQSLADMECRIRENERLKAGNLLHSKPRHKVKKMNGHGGLFRSSVKQY